MQAWIEDVHVFYGVSDSAIDISYFRRVRRLTGFGHLQQHSPSFEDQLRRIAIDVVLELLDR